MIKIRYIDTKAITVHIFSEQRCMLERIKEEIEIECGLKVPISELIRQSLDKGIPLIKENKDFLKAQIKR